jgi:tRNA G10  N-methylase Trm11
MQQSLVILGRQPALGLAELESLYGAKSITPFGDKYALLDINAKDIQFNRLGSVIKIASVLTELPTTEWSSVETYLLKMVPEHIDYIPEEGKFNLGLSAYGMRTNPKIMTRTALTLKKIIKSHGRSVRIVPNKGDTMSTPQILHNHLLGERGWELLAVRYGNKTLVCLTMGEQDIDAYTARDQARPKRDAFVGMLPPKLAQTIINLALGPVGNTPPLPITQSPPPTILDPFCGTGVILQEALLMGYDVQGTDNEPRMVEYSTENIQWLHGRWREATGLSNIGVGDARNHKWQQPISTVATETYLGHPMSTIPNSDKVQAASNPVNLLVKEFLKNLHPQLKPGTRLCIAVPAWHVGNNRFKHLPMLDRLTDLGYNRMVLERVATKDLLYFRPDQIVARELVILIRK